MTRYLSFFSIVFFLFTSCKEGVKPRFEILENNQTGLDFANHLEPTAAFNMFKYMYFYNGAGIGAGDFNNDGKTDLFFTSNQGQNTLYINQGNLRFKDVTKEASIPVDGGWSTGVSVVDINNDGLLDIYVCKVSSFENLKGSNQLLVCQGIKEGIPHYKEMAKEFGLAFSGFSTQAAFFDFDLDGDLDMFLMNHSVHHNGTFGRRAKFMNTYHPLSGDRFYRNDNGKFTDITKESGINSSVIGYGLGIVISDINLDGYPDIYIGNDFHENDYLYINQGNGTFKDELTDRIMHTSQFSMGVDAADINNDGWPEIVSLDMLPDDPYILRRSLGEDEYNLFKMKIGYGYNYQYARNNLQLNLGNAQFSETALYSGVFATDWSWAPLWVDFDNDGWKDLFISNGIPRRLNDMDYVNYITNDELQQKIREDKMTKDDMSLIEKFPQIKLPNRFFQNKQDVRFEDITSSTGNNKQTFSNGAIFADLDNDGDLDIVVNNIDDPVMVYRNNTMEIDSAASITLKLIGPKDNINAIGATVFAYAGKEVRTYEKYPVHGFQSSMEIPLQIGLKNTIDSLCLVWPDNSYERIHIAPGEKNKDCVYKIGLPKADKKSFCHFKNSILNIDDITDEKGLKFLHQENNFVEFNREPLLPRMLSTEGPALAIADINGDGLDDVFVGASKSFKPGLFLQDKNGNFESHPQEALIVDSMYEDVDACWTDVNNDKFPDLVIASGGNEYYGRDHLQLPRVYLNDGKGHLTRFQDAFENVFITGSCVLPYDFNGDGFVDLFIGARAVPYDYGKMPESYFLQNDGTGKFINVSDKVSDQKGFLGFVRQGKWIDIDQDGDKDLVLALEWDGILAMVNDNGYFRKKMLTKEKGWWNFILPVDINADGLPDLIAGNLGLNSRLKASAGKPVKLYCADFDGNGTNEQVLTYFLGDQELPFSNKMELEKQMPFLKKKFLYAQDFAKAGLFDVFDNKKLSSATTLSADYFENSLLINKGNLNFEVHPLPWQAQLTPYMDGVVLDANSDGLQDVFLGGNFYENNIQMGRNDADQGTVLINTGKNSYRVEPTRPLLIKGQVRKILPIKLADHSNSFCLARNSDSVMLVRFNKMDNKH